MDSGRNFWDKKSRKWDLYIEDIAKKSIYQYTDHPPKHDVLQAILI